MGLYGSVAFLAAFTAQLALNALASARPPGWGTLRENLAQDWAVAAGILAACVAVLVTAVVAAAGQKLFVGKMQSQKLATIAAAGMVAIGALPGALAALLSLPLVRRFVRSISPPRAIGVTGVLLLALAGLGALGVVVALSRADWRVLDLGPLYALAAAIGLGVGHGLFWFGSSSGRLIRGRLPQQPAPPCSPPRGCHGFGVGARGPDCPRARQPMGPWPTTAGACERCSRRRAG